MELYSKSENDSEVH